MCAISQDVLGGPEVLKEVRLDVPDPGPNELLVRVHAAGLNPTDWKHRASGAFLGTPPFVLGWDVSGVVETVGTGVTLFRAGDDVFGMLPHPHGAGAHAEYVTGPARAFAEQQRFAANASHELRTPLAISRTLLDVARKDPTRERDDLIERLHVINQRATGLTEALLLLSRGDRGNRLFRLHFPGGVGEQDFAGAGEAEELPQHDQSDLGLFARNDSTSWASARASPASPLVRQDDREVADDGQGRIDVVRARAGVAPSRPVPVRTAWVVPATRGRSG
ncbi:alcohol dehydrogenase catalytic domain-containing protein [Streptomyces uncialis]|uniref:alcohol dehydrogenase catalytic domain-containing protein n=1 Tax=Streptomyces uncialis TaxID=1048205 RepID=UPI003863F78D|nr:alcohol dehydrogenase catalytic domain-containing protein [Streptomyces uncialis]